MDVTPRMLGIYIDCTGASRLADLRVCIVERTRSGKVILRAAGEDCTMKVLINHLTSSELAQLVETLHHDRTEAAI